MKINFFSKLRDLANFIITPLTLNKLKQWEFYFIYSIAIIPAILITYNTIDKFQQKYIHNENVNQKMYLEARKKKDVLLDFKKDYRLFSEISKKDDCSSLLSTRKPEQSVITKKSPPKWLACINKLSLKQRVKNFISEKSDTLDAYHTPVNTFKIIAVITNKSLTNPVKYTAFTPTTQEFYTVLPVKLKYTSSFEETLQYMHEISDNCSSCEVSIHKLVKTTKNNYHIELVVKLNLEIPNKDTKMQLTQQVSSGVFSGINLSDFVKENTDLIHEYKGHT